MTAFVASIPDSPALVDRAGLEVMAKALSYRSETPLSSKQAGAVTYVAVPSRLSRQSGLQSVAIHNQQKLLLLADARIDARSDLVRRLRLDHQQVTSASLDAELLLAAYIAWGEELMEHVLGDYSFVIIKLATGDCFAGRSVYGVKPLYWARTSSSLVVSSDISALLAHPEVDKRPSRQAIFDYLLLGSASALDSSLTPYQSIRSLPPSSALRVSKKVDSLHLKQTMGLHVPEPVCYASPTKLFDEFGSVLRDSVRDRVSGEDVCLLLSGGLDSSALAVILADLRDRGEGPRSLNAFTVAQSSDDPELLGARAVAKKLGIPHHFAELDITCVSRPPKTIFPTQSSILTAQWKIYSQAAQLGKIWVSGSGFDEVLGKDRRSILSMAKHYGFRVAAHAGYTELLHQPLHVIGKFSASASTKLQYDPLKVPDWLAPTASERKSCEERWWDFWRWKSIKPFDTRLQIHQERPHAQRSLLRAEWRVQDNPASGFIPSEQVFPALDIRILRCLWSTPCRPWNTSKLLLRSYFSDQLPKEVLRAPKRYLSPHTGYRDDRAGNEKFKDWSLSDRVSEWVDVERVPPMPVTNPVDLRPYFLDEWLMHQVGDSGY